MRKKVNTHFENSLNGFHSIRAFLEYSSAANDVLNTRAGKPLLSTHLRGKKSTEIKGFRPENGSTAALLFGVVFLMMVIGRVPWKQLAKLMGTASGSCRYQ